MCDRCRRFEAGQKRVAVPAVWTVNGTDLESLAASMKPLPDSALEDLFRGQRDIAMAVARRQKIFVAKFLENRDKANPLPGISKKSMSSRQRSKLARAFDDIKFIELDARMRHLTPKVAILFRLDEERPRFTSTPVIPNSMHCKSAQ